MARCTNFISERAGSVLALAALVVVSHLVWPTGLFGSVTFLVVTGGATVFAWRCARCCPKGERSGPAWLAFGLGASAVGDATWAILELMPGGAPDVSVADIAWIASYIGVGVGVFKMISPKRDERRSRFDDGGLIDMAIVGIVALLTVWYLWVEPTLTDSSAPLLTRSVWALYPVLDAALLALMARTVTGRRLSERTILGLSLGATCWLLSDLGSLVFVEREPLGRWLDAGWMIGAVLLATATFRATRSKDPPAADENDEVWIGAGRLAVSFAPLLVPGLLELRSFLSGQDTNPIPLLVATAALTTLAFTRALLLSGLARDTNRRLAASRELYQRLAENSSDAVLLVSPTGEILNDASMLLTMFGYPPGTTRGRNLFERVWEEDAARGRKFLDQAHGSPGVVVVDELRARRRGGEIIWLAVRAVNLLELPAVGAIVLNLHDITKRKQAELELEHRAFHDPLTGLANRALFRDRLEHALDRRGRTGLDPAVVYIDLDDFKTVNDSMGHDAGDDLLRAVAGRIATLVRTGDTVARLGGDEFAVLIEPLADPLAESASIADRILESLSSFITTGDHQVHAAASLGVAVADENSTPSSLLRDADVAMYQAKTNGKNRWVRHEPEMHIAAVQRLQILNELNRALVSNEFHLVYQPVVDLATERIVGFEALIRWDHPELGNVPPDVFIPVAEENGLIIPIGQWVLRTACATVAGWRRRNPTTDFSIAVNLSGRQLDSPTIVSDVRSALSDAHLDPTSLVLEMTETSLIGDPAGASRVLHELRSLGIKLAIDDFGTGYSSLSYLQQFPIDILKVDRSFVQTITDTDTPAIVRGLLELGHTLKLDIIAEGIESQTQLRHLREENCEHGQGYLFSRPLDAAAAEARLEQDTRPLATG